jgi:hypothetical protein
MLGYTYIACLVISIYESNLFDSYFIQNIPHFLSRDVVSRPVHTDSQYNPPYLIFDCAYVICTSRWPIQWVLKLRLSAISVVNYLFINSHRR